ncbi:MAG: leucine-rich repeat protein [Bacteroidales bacterium]|nr:leucine-rich repeat protein [Bacteroidales bacterium]
MANISENLSTVKQSLIDIKNAIVDRGVTPTGNITTYAEAIYQLCLCGGSVEGKELYIENVGDSDGVFKLTKFGSPTYVPNLIYRIDNGEWFEYDVASLPSITVPSGSKIYFRGNNANGFNQSTFYYYIFNFSTFFNIGGYITSLLALDNFNTITDIPNYCFNLLFENQGSLRNAEDLIVNNIITVDDNGFDNCFSGCINLTTSPSFENVTIVGDYGFRRCFENCKSLTTAPNFSNVTTVGSNGFDFCFISCTSLTTAPNFSNVTTVGSYGFESCFNRCSSLTTAPTFDKIKTIELDSFSSCFSGCSSLTTAPTFKDVITVENMAIAFCFQNCTSLTTAPLFINLTTVNGDSFSHCFQNCTSLVNAPQFQNITTINGNSTVSYNSFDNCFDGCTNLQVIYTPNISTWNTSMFSDWVKNVAPTGIIFKPTNLEIPLDSTSGIPTGWSVINYVE